MTDDARRALTNEARDRVQEARRRGGMCGLCGRALAADEPVWIERLPVYGAGSPRWWAPLGGECASPAFRAEVAGTAPAPCVSCGRGVYYRSAHPRRRLAFCSRRCEDRHHNARAYRARRKA